MYDVGISCPKLGVSCNGPNFSAITTQERIEWIKKRKNFLGWSNAKLAEESHTPKGTIDSLLSGNRSGANTETLRPIFEALIGGYTNKPCPNPPTEADIAMEEKLACQAELIEKQEKTIERLKKENKKLTDHIENTAELHHADFDIARKEDQHTIKFLRIVISALILLLIVTFGIIFLALLVDRLNPSIGFFWLEEAVATVFSGHTGGLFDGTGVLEGVPWTKL